MGISTKQVLGGIQDEVKFVILKIIINTNLLIYYGPKNIYATTRDKI